MHVLEKKKAQIPTVSTLRIQKKEGKWIPKEDDGIFKERRNQWNRKQNIENQRLISLKSKNNKRENNDQYQEQERVTSLHILQLLKG